MSRVVRTSDPSAERFGTSVLAVGRRWKLLQLFLAWLVFFLVATLLMFLSSWNSMVSKAILGAASLQFLLLLTAANSLVVPFVIAFSASRQHGWPSLELRLIRFSVESGIPLLAFGLVTAFIVLPSFRLFSLPAVSALVVFPSFVVVYNICLYVMASSFVNRRKASSTSGESKRSFIVGVAIPFIIFAAILGLMVVFFPKVTFDVEVMHDCALKRGEMSACIAKSRASSSSATSG